MVPPHNVSMTRSFAIKHRQDMRKRHKLLAHSLKIYCKQGDYFLNRIKNICTLPYQNQLRNSKLHCGYGRKL